MGDLTYASVCSGIEAASVAWEPLGWRPAFVAEIDPFPCAVLAHRYPSVPNLGDFTKIEGSPQPVDVLVGGTPCQSFSVAGLRGGMDDPRGNLALEYLRLAGRLRPDWLVWENVPGVLSSNGGRDFGAFLGGLAEFGYGWAYRVLDAQFFGVPQRRRRVFVVAHSGGLWQRAVAVLFERACLSGNPPASGETGAKIAGCVNESPGMRGWGNDDEALVTSPLMSHSGLHDANGQTFVAHSLRADGFDASEDGTGRGTPLVPVAFGWNKSASQTMRVGQTCDALQASPASNPAIAYQCHGGNVGPMGVLRSGNGHAEEGVPFIVNAAESCARQSHARPSEVARCLDSTGSFASAQGGTVVGCDFRNMAETEDVAQTLQVGGHGTSPSNHPHVAMRSGVRRLTPRECERLQGFPDDYSLVPYRGKPAADGNRYKALGNSFAVPVVAWIGRRIEAVRDLDSTSPDAAWNQQWLFDAGAPA